MPNCIGISEVNILRTIIHYKKFELLKHPLCDLFLHLKWKRAHVLYYVVKAIHILFTLLVICYTLVYHGELGHQTDWIFRNCSNTSHYEDNETILDRTGDTIDNERAPCKYWRFVPILIWIISFILFLMHTTKVFQNRHSFDWSLTREYITEDILPLLAVVLFVISDAGFGFGMDRTEAIYSIKFHRSIAGLLVLICCHSMAYTMSRDSENAIFVEMMFKIMGNLCKFLVSYIWLFLGWFAAFHVVMGLTTTKSAENQSSFRDIFAAFAKTVTMFTGDLGFETTGGFSSLTSFESGEWYSLTIWFLYIFFIFEMSVVLMNQLIGLAITNIQELAEDADGLRLVKEVMFQKYMESFMHVLPSFPKRFRQRNINRRLGQLVTKDIYNGNAIYCVDQHSFNSGSRMLHLNMKDSSVINNNLAQEGAARQMSDGTDASVVGMTISPTVDIKSVPICDIPSNVVNKLKCLFQGNEQKIKEKEEKDQNDIKKILHDLKERIEQSETQKLLTEKKILHELIQQKEEIGRIEIKTDKMDDFIVRSEANFKKWLALADQMIPQNPTA